MADLVGRLQRAVPPTVSLTFFEMTTALALLYFAESQVDLAVLEVGMGGRFDATNVVESLACAITTIGLDHQEYLGTTEAAIAFEKAGIIKSAVPVVIGGFFVAKVAMWEVWAIVGKSRGSDLAGGTSF